MECVLRIDQQATGELGRYQAILNWTEDDRLPRAVSVRFAFALSAQDFEDIRWYLEDYLEFSDQPAPQIAARIESRMGEIGEELFRALFYFDDDARDLWSAIRTRLSDTRIEIVAEITDTTAIPWELIRDPRTRSSLALRARAFVRGQRGAPAVPPPSQVSQSRKIRILLAICRPQGREDVPFRSVAARITKSLEQDSRKMIALDVLRPPTFDSLASKLRRAREEGKPYDIVHFDGHGIYADMEQLKKLGPVRTALKFDAGKVSGKRGCVVFEAPDNRANAVYVDGFRLGALLRDASVPVLILNACQSAFAESSAVPSKLEEVPFGLREEIEAYGSLAQAVVDAGVAGVVAMRYSVYVVTAARFVTELYSNLLRGSSLGEAVSSARKHLADKPEREIAFEPRPLQDWSVPVVWERAPFRLWPAPAEQSVVGPGETLNFGAAHSQLPARPDTGFFGGDETLYELDRAFDDAPIVLLHGYAGAGKTAIAVEFARWYALTGGVDGVLVFSSFEQYTPIDRVLDAFGQAFAGILAAAGIQWESIASLGDRRELALQMLRRASTLWIWDNIEPVNGFPAGSPSAWSIEQQGALRSFLIDATDAGSRAKFLLTSRRDEYKWLAELPARVGMRPMSMQDRQLLAGVLTQKRGRRLATLPDLRPLLHFTEGNPLTIVATVGQVLRGGIRSPEQLGEFVNSLRFGEARVYESIEEINIGLVASLAHGLKNAFTHDERRIVSLLFLFQGVIFVDILRNMGDPERDWCLDAIRGIGDEEGTALLAKAQEVGMLTGSAGVYQIHPALRSFFRTLFEEHFPERQSGDARRAFCFTFASFANTLYERYIGGERSLLVLLVSQEDNLQSTLALARKNKWLKQLIGIMQGLRAIFVETSRYDTWRRLVDDIHREVTASETNGRAPENWPGEPDDWFIFNDYRIDILRHDGNFADAEREQRKALEWIRARAEPLLAIDSSAWTDEQRNFVHSLGVTLETLGKILRASDNPDCMVFFEDALEVYRRAGIRQKYAECAREIGGAYRNVAGLRDLDAAMEWHKRSLGLLADEDTTGRGACLMHLGINAYDRADEIVKAITREELSKREAEILAYISQAINYLNEALRFLPQSALDDFAVIYNALGGAYGLAGYMDEAVKSFQQSIRYNMLCGDTFSAGQTRHNVAVYLTSWGRLGDARAYAAAAMEDFGKLPNAVAKFREAERLLHEIDRQIAEAKDRG